MRFKILLLTCFTAFGSFAQEEGDVPSFDENFWQENPSLTTLTEEEKKSNAVYLADINVTTYDFGSYLNNSSGNWVDNAFLEENLYYKRIRLNNDKAVEIFNKVYISMLNDKTVWDLKARAITKEGKVIEFDESNKKEIENYENYGPFTIFALEGIEVGSEIEYTYKTKEPFRAEYFSVDVQSNFPKRNFHYEINSPLGYNFKMKSYNGLPSFIQDTSDVEEANRYVLKLDQVEKFKKEDYSLEDALKQRAEVKIFEIEHMALRNLNDYNKAATRNYTNIYSGKYPKEVKKENKAIKGLIKANKWDKIKDQEKQIIAIEHYLKREFDQERTGEFYVYKPIQSKVYSQQNALRIYAKLFNQLDIDHQIVITCNRYEKTFDEDFETPAFLDGFLLYFPKYDKFISPVNDYMRYGLIPSAYAYNKGLFIKTISLGNATSALPEIKEIPGTDHTVNFDNMYMDIAFDEDFEKVKAHVKHEASGYSSAYLRPIMPLVNEEKKKEILEERFKSFAEDAEVSNITTANEEMEGNMLKKPFIFEGDVESNSLIEKAGNKYLFKMGLVIGPQVEMYQDTARKFPVENSYNHGYLRELNITIPEGYKITNLEDLNMDYSSSSEGKKTMEFTSKYVVEGNVVKVTCYEYYNEIRVPLERYEEFRTVINAAADFNKITLVFEPN